jgi:hypothetical protein
VYKRVATVLLAALSLTAWVRPAAATTISYTATNTVGAQWRYDYVLGAAAGEAPITEFTIYFGVSAFTGADLRGIVTAPGWDGLVAAVDPLLPADGFVDFLAQPGSGVGAPGSTQAGFAVLFDWFGTSAPGSQPFDIVDSQTFQLLRSGVTTPAGVVGVPEPGTTLLLGLGLLSLVAARCAALRRTTPHSL